jgi:hypothetical protein
LLAALALFATCSGFHGATEPDLQLLDPEGTLVRDKGVHYHFQSVDFSATGSGITDGSGKMDPQVPSKAAVYEFSCLVPGLGYCYLEPLNRGGNPDGKPVQIRLKPGGRIIGKVVEQGTLRPVGGVILQPEQMGPGGKAAGFGNVWNAPFALLWQRTTLAPPNASGVVVGLERLGPAEVTWAVSQDGDGSFLLQNLPPGEYDLIPFGGIGSWKFRERVRVEEGKTTKVREIRVPSLPTGRSALGPVLQPDGKTPAGQTEITFELIPVPEQAQPPILWKARRRAVPTNRAASSFIP